MNKQGQMLNDACKNFIYQKYPYLTIIMYFLRWVIWEEEKKKNPLISN